MNQKTTLSKTTFAKFKIILFIVFVGLIPFAKAQTFTQGNLAVFVTASATANNTTASIIELNKTTVAQTAVNTYTINGTALRFSGSATSTGYLSNSNDGSLICFNGGVTTTTANINTITSRAVGSFNAAGTFSIATTYTGSSGNQTRSSTSLNNTTFFIGDQGGMYSNGTTSASPSGNIRSAKSFGGSVYVSTASSSTATIQVSTISAPTGGTITGLPGLTNNASLQDFYLISSGSNGSAFDVLYVLSATSNTVGSITKYSLISGSWVSNGSYTTTFGGFGIVAEINGSSANIYVSDGLGALSANHIIKLIDAAGYNSTINITTTSNVTLYTTAAGTTIKGVAFAPACSTPIINSASSNSPVCASSTLTFSSSVIGASLAYSWSGPNSFTTTSQNPTINNATTAASGIYTLTLTNSCGASATATSSVTVNASPNIYNVTGGGSFCSGGAGVSIGLDNSDVNINYQLMNGATSVGTPIAGTGTVITFPNQTTSATYTILASDATTSCASNMNGNAMVSITPTVTPDVNISANPGSTICSGTNVTFSATVNNGGGTPVYQWLLNGVADGSNNATYSNNTLNNGDLIVCTLTSNAACVTASTVNSNTITINVTTSVIPSVSILSSTGNSNCAGTNITFSATPTNGGTTPTYQWALNGTTVGNATDTYSNNTLNDQDVITCTMTSSNGCASPSIATANSLTMTVIPNVTPSVSITSNPTGIICAGTSVTFSAIPTNGGTPSYVWTKNGTTIGNNSDTYTDGSLINNDVLICTMTSNATCLTTNTASISVTTTVNTNPVPVVSGTFTFCASGSTTLDAGAGYATYLWNNNATTQTISVTSAGIYSVMVSDGTCSGSSSTVTVTSFNAASQPGAFTTSSSSVLLGQTGVVYTVPNDPTVTYNWNYTGTGATINGAGNSVTVDFSSSATSGTLNVTATNNCGTSAATNIFITPALQPSFTTGNLVLLQTSNTASKVPSPITLKEITTSGASGINITLPSTGSAAFQTSGMFGGSEGFLTTSTDQKYLVLAGYSTSLTAGDVTATTALSTPRAIGVVYPSCFFQQVYSSTTNFDMNDIRGAISDGTNFWAVGASGANTDGVDYYGPGTPAGLGTGATPPKGYATRIFNGQIYYSTQKAGPSNTATQLGIFSFGTGLTTSGNPTPTQLINTGSTVVEDFSINPTTDVCYVAVNLNTAAGGIQKWTKTGSIWSLAYTLGTGITNTGAYGLVVDYSGANPIIYATTFDAGGNRVIKIIDTGAASVATTILPATSNVYYKGITFAPIPSGTPVVDLTISQDTASEAAMTNVVVTANTSFAVTGTQTVTLNVSGTGITTGDYTLSNTTITIPSGSTTGSVTFTVVDDGIIEPTEIASVTISNPSTGLILGSVITQTVSIKDNGGNNPPTILMDVVNTTDYIDSAASTSPISPYTVSGTINDPTDPASTLGIGFLINDIETPAASLTVTTASSNTVVVPNANITITGTGSSINVKIASVAIGYANITVSVFDGINTSSYVINFASSDPSPVLTPANTFWHTGLSDASDAIAIDDNYYMTGDDELDYINVYSRNHSGLPAVSFDASSYLNLPDPSSPEADLEAAAESPKTPNRSYWLGSMSNGKAPFNNKPNRDRLFATHHTGTGATTTISFVGFSAIRSALLTWGDANGYAFSTSAAAGVDSKSFDGFSAEGMTFAPDSTTLWIGLRAPLVPTTFRTKAVIAPILNFEAWFNNGNQTGSPTFGTPIELDLNLNGIRDIIRLSNGTYIIVAGSPLDAAGSNELYKWTGNAADAPIHVPSAGGGNLNMEGAMEMHTGGQLSLTKIQVITDGGADVLYNDGNEAKDFGNLNLRKFRSDVLTGVDLDICTGYSVAINTSGSTSFCAGDSVKLTATASTSSYTWSTGINTSTITIKNSGTYTVTSTNTHSGCLDTSSVSITENALPNVNANATATVVCAGQQTILSGVGATTYTWTNSVNNGTAFTPTASATYTVTGTDIHNCTNTNTVNVTVNALPTVPIISQSGNVLTASIATSYQWYYNGSLITGATSQSYTATQTGTYDVLIGDVNTCTATSNTVAVTITGIASIQNKMEDAVVKPNPFENNFDLDFSAENGNYTIELYNTIGQRVATLFNGELATGSIHFNFNSLSNLNNGIYFLKIQSGTSYRIIKICQAR